jgi:hypothetical protein
MPHVTESHQKEGSAEPQMTSGFLLYVAELDSFISKIMNWFLGMNTLAKLRKEENSTNVNLLQHWSHCTSENGNTSFND